MAHERDGRYDRHNRSQSRSLSPYRPKEGESSRRHRRHKSHNEHREGRSKKKEPRASTHGLPYGSRELTKRDFEAFRPMFALYLDIQKKLELEDLDTSEQRGRWKSFVGKWNRGELAEGWYDPATLTKAIESSNEAPQPQGSARTRRRPSPEYGETREAQQTTRDSSEDEYGPAPDAPRTSASRSGPAIPTTRDLDLRRELIAEDEEEGREELRLERRANRKLDKERLEELAPRAEAGTRERQLEKRKEVASSNRAFAAAKEGGDVAEVPESDLMGGDEGIADFKRQKHETERRKNEREIRREEIMRAKKEEREERAREFREREERTMAGLKELAKQRFG